MRFFAIACALLLATPSFVQANPLDKPQERVILTISGSIAATNDRSGAQFDRPMFEALPQSSIRTVTPWTEGEVTFTGVRMKDLLDAVGARGDEILATALNDYRQSIPSSDLENHEVLVAVKMNGKYMRVRDKGPLWIIYKLDSVDSSAEEASKMVWQLDRLEVR